MPIVFAVVALQKGSFQLWERFSVKEYLPCGYP